VWVPPNAGTQLQRISIRMRLQGRPFNGLLYQLQRFVRLSLPDGSCNRLHSSAVAL
jgi:hypothetical protein